MINVRMDEGFQHDETHLHRRGRRLYRAQLAHQCPLLQLVQRAMEPCIPLTTVCSDRHRSHDRCGADHGGRSTAHASYGLSCCEARNECHAFGNEP